MLHKKSKCPTSKKHSGFYTQGIILAVILFAAISGLTAGLLGSLIYDLPEINKLKQFRPMEVSTILDINGQIIDRFFKKKRFPVSIENISPFLIMALITTEDRSFYSHSGINPKGILRAILQDIKYGHFKQGGSTLTQQLAKTLFLSSEKSIVRKIKEALLSLQIERLYSKKEILELYLNQIYLGSGSYGVEAACKTYFNLKAKDITLGQAALIAGLPKAPSRYSPLTNPKLARIRRNTVLKQMLDTKIISTKSYQEAMEEPILVNTIVNYGQAKAPFFTSYIKQLLENFPDLVKKQQGIKIYTTLDLNLNQSAKKSINYHLKSLENRTKKNGQTHLSPEAAVVGLNVETGGIRILVGGKNFSKSPFNRAIQAKRQPGSAFKPFVYATAISKGYSQRHLLEDSPLEIRLQNGTSWQVKNFSPHYEGQITMRLALALSKNTTAVRLLQDINANSIIEFARKAGIKSYLAPYPSLALGAFELNLMELTSAYIPFANQGIGAKPFAIKQITDRDGHTLFSFNPERTNVMSRQDAAIVTDMLKAAIFEGTGKKAARLQQDIAGKTGTTNSYKDALFLGYSPELVVGVWVGNDDASSLGNYETGSRAALPIWIDIMENFFSNEKIQYFDIPDQTKMVYIDNRSGKILENEQNLKNPNRVKMLLKTPYGSLP